MLQSHSLMTMHPNILITLLSPEEGVRGGAFPDIVLIEGGGGKHRGGALQRVLFHFLFSFSSFSFSCNEWHEEESGKRPVLSKATLPKSMITMVKESAKIWWTY